MKPPTAPSDHRLLTGLLTLALAAGLGGLLAWASSHPTAPAATVTADTP